MKSLQMLVGIAFIVFGSGCAFVDQRISLRYSSQTRSVSAGVGDRLLLVAVPEGSDRLNRKGNSYIIGNVKNTYGMKTADTITDDNVGDWIIAAFSQELQTSGITVRRVERLPEVFDSGINVVILRVWVDQDPGFWTVGAVSEISIILEIYSKGDLLKKVAIDGKGDRRGMLSTSGDREESLEKALRAVMAQAVPEILSVMR